MRKIDRVLQDVDLSSSVGAILIAASVTISGSACAGTSMTKQWLMRRPVRNPAS